MPGHQHNTYRRANMPQKTKSSFTARDQVSTAGRRAHWEAEDAGERREGEELQFMKTEGSGAGSFGGKSRGSNERAPFRPIYRVSPPNGVQTGQLGRLPPRRARPLHASARRGSHANICVRSLTRVTARWDRLLWGYGSFVALLSGFKNR